MTAVALPSSWVDITARSQVPCDTVLPFHRVSQASQCYETYIPLNIFLPLLLLTPHPSILLLAPPSSKSPHHSLQLRHSSPNHSNRPSPRGAHSRRIPIWRTGRPTAPASCTAQQGAGHASRRGEARGGNEKTILERRQRLDGQRYVCSANLPLSTVLPELSDLPYHRI